MRVSVAAVGVEAHLPQGLDHARLAFRRRADVVGAQPLLDDLPDGQARAQAAVGVLEHDLHVLAQRLEPATVEIVNRAPGELDGAAAGDKAQQREPQRGLARAALADDADRVALANAHADVVGGLDVVHDPPQHAAAHREPHAHVLAAHYLRGVRVSARRPARGLRGEQHLGVRVLGVSEDLPRLSLLDDAPVLHHAHPLGHALDDAEVVRDQQHRHAHALLQLAQQLEDLRLDGDVERRGGLVGDEEVRLVGERHGDHHALALAARELMGVGAEALLGLLDADHVQQLQRALARRRRRHALVQDQRLTDLLRNRVQWVERRHRLLEDHADLVAARTRERRRVGADEFGAAISDGAARMARGGIRQQLQDGERRHRFAGAALTDQRQGLPALQRERHVAHGLDVAARCGEGHAQVLHHQHGRVGA